MQTESRRRGAAQRYGRAIKLAAGIAAATLALAACGASNSYPTYAQTSFLDGCQTEASHAECSCMLTYIEGHLSFSSYAANAAQTVEEIRAGADPTWLTDAAQTCT
jgi:hypothetical protein